MENKTVQMFTLDQLKTILNNLEIIDPHVLQYDNETLILSYIEGNSDYTSDKCLWWLKEHLYKATEALGMSLVHGGAAYPPPVVNPV